MSIYLPHFFESLPVAFWILPATLGMLCVAFGMVRSYHRPRTSKIVWIGCGLLAIDVIRAAVNLLGL